jgi:hypothetical protein
MRTLSAERARIFDLDVLPTRDEIVEAFGPQTFDGAFGIEAKADLHYARQDAGQFEVLNAEFVDGLAAYLVARAKAIRSGKASTTTILEVGAGTGKLSHFLKKGVDQLVNEKLEIIATDSGSWEHGTHHPVELMGHEEALDRYSPDIVIASWMPNDVDWTQDMRDTPSVVEYLLIGEGPGGNCGDDWLTWGSPGNEMFNLERKLENSTGQTKSELANRLEMLKATPVPSASDGFAMHYLEDLSALQTPVYSLHSETCSFRRESA